VAIDNLGDLRVGPGVVVSFYGAWDSPALSEPLYADMMLVPLTDEKHSLLTRRGTTRVRR
jgi:hypothetical protein